VISGRRVLAVIPARGGSKGIPLKNLREIQGRSLVAIASEIASKVPEIDRRIISTDHELIAQAAMRAGLAAPFRRPTEISGDLISDLEVLQHALLTMEDLDQVTYDIVVMLQPTSPLRKVSDVVGTIHMLVEKDLDAVWSVSMTDSKAHPLKQLVIRDNKMHYWDARGAAIIARQQLEPVYHRNGVAYAISRSCLMQQNSIKGAHTGAYIVEDTQISIDTEWDIELIEFALSRGFSCLS